MLYKGTEERACDQCGAVNLVSFTDYPERDKGELLCAGCNAVLIKWKGTRDYHDAVLKQDLEIGDTE